MKAHDGLLPPLKSGGRHFLDLHSVAAEELRKIIDDAKAQKAARAHLPKGAADPDLSFQGELLAMIFEKPSTRTRVSFDVGMRQLGGQSLVLSGQDMQLGRGESVPDTALVLSRYVDAIMIRTNEHKNLLEMAENAEVPVINGLTDDSHPCQIMADVMTFEEHQGQITGKRLCWTGDGNNVSHSFMEAAALFGFSLTLACPETLDPSPRFLNWARAQGGDESLINNSVSKRLDTGRSMYIHINGDAATDVIVDGYVLITFGTGTRQYRHGSTTIGGMLLGHQLSIVTIRHQSLDCLTMGRYQVPMILILAPILMVIMMDVGRLILGVAHHLVLVMTWTVTIWYQYSMHQITWRRIVMT